MKKLGLVLAAAAMVAFAGGDVMAGKNGNGNGAPAGAHYNLNIIGVDNAKEPKMTDSNRHVIFVALNSRGGTATNIWLTEGTFKVCDGNGFDDAFDCSGTQIGRDDAPGAVFRLPCNEAQPADGTGHGGDDIDCDEDTATHNTSTSYEVWARALGGGGDAIITTCAWDAGVKVCNTGGDVLVLTRTSGKQVFKDVSKELTSITAVINGRLRTVCLFCANLEDFVWEYDNNGLRLAQLRFYLSADIK